MGGRQRLENPPPARLENGSPLGQLEAWFVDGGLVGVCNLHLNRRRDPGGMMRPRHESYRIV